jgi:hypothetical protein
LASRCTPPGSIYRNLRGLAGVAYGNLIAVDVDGGWQTERAQTYVWDRDGLFVGGIMDAVDLDAAPEVMYHLGGELAHATVATFPDGKVYFAGNWENEVRLYEVSGWDGWERQTGELLVKHAAPDSVGQGLTAEYFRDEAFRGPAAVRVEGRIALDGRAMRARAPEGSRAGPHSARWRGELVPTYGPRYAGAWTRVEDPRASGGALHLSHATGDRVECKFRGTSIKVLGLVGRRTGVVNVELDGKPIATNVDLSRDETAYGVTLFERAGLSRGDHVIVLESRGTRHSPIGGALAIERFVAGPLAIDADGLPYTFHVDTTGEARLWLDGTSLLSAQPHPGAPARLSSTALKLERRGHPIQLSLAAGTSSARITLSWSSPLDPERPVPERALFPVVHDARSAWAGAADGLNQ